MAKFTPGPWEWDAGIIPPDGPGRYADVYVEGGEKIIARFNDCIPEGRANAALITAAPALYEALSECEAMLTVLATAYGEDEHEGVKRCVNAGRAALAAARQQEE
jgi:hypothetical protein